MKKLSIMLVSLVLQNTIAQSQGCVAIRNLAGFGQFAQLGYQSKDKWMLDISNRYFTAFNVFEGKQNKGYSDSINLYENTLNIQLSHLMKNGWSFSLNVPVAANQITSRLEHGSGVRHSTTLLVLVISVLQFINGFLIQIRLVRVISRLALV